MHFARLVASEMNSNVVSLGMYAGLRAEGELDIPDPWTHDLDHHAARLARNLGTGGSDLHEVAGRSRLGIELNDQPGWPVRP